MNSFASKDFLSDLDKFIRNYPDVGLSNVEKTLALSPARVLESLLLGFYALSLAGDEDNMQEEPVLSCTNTEDYAKAVDIIENVAAKFATQNATEIYRMFYEEVLSSKWNATPLPSYILPSVIAAATTHMLKPILKEERSLLKKGIHIKPKKW